MNSNALDLTVQAFTAYLIPFCQGANVYGDKRSGDKQAPSVTISTINATEDPPNMGNFWVDVEIVVRTIGAVDTDGTDPKTDSDSLETSVYEAIEDEDLANLLNSQGVTDYTVMGFSNEKSFDQSLDGDCWVTTWRRRLYCGRFS